MAGGSGAQGSLAEKLKPHGFQSRTGKNHPHQRRVQFGEVDELGRLERTIKPYTVSLNTIWRLTRRSRARPT